jgi:glucose-6-phosphate isomerase
MNLSKQQLWERFKNYYSEYPTLGLALDLSRMNFRDDFFPSMEGRMQKAFAAMAELEKGAIANPDEKRMVGHYWLRNSALAPAPEIRKEIESTITDIKSFASQVHKGAVCGAKGAFKNLLLIGIGGSALGPQFVSQALGHPAKDKLRFYSFDNTDPDGMDRVLAEIGTGLAVTLCLVISKSGGTKETRNGMLEAQAAYEKAGLDFGRHAVAVTQAGSELDKNAVKNNWIRRFPMWDWVGGRTSVLSAVGLLPAALQGIEIDSLLKGAKSCDEITRSANVRANPSALLALAWYQSGNGIGTKDMVVIPYKDRLEYFSKYLQQLIMESIGKEKDLAGKVVNQGICVLGNKGSTDQHSYIQQLRDGVNNFFATFIEVLRDRSETSIEVEPNITSGDYLRGFLLGTRQALYENNRETITITIPEVTSFSVGMLIALYERAVGLYASLVNINAYHQPGVEAGKKAATTIIDLELRVIRFLNEHPSSAFSLKELGTGIGREDEIETVFKICEQFAANPQRRIAKIPGASPFDSQYKKT